jgi:dihydroorotate dehydrogenase (fumarate)
MIDLTTRYLGLALKNPLVCASSTLGQDLDTLRQMEDAGAAAVVLPSLFEEQIEREGRGLDPWLTFGAESDAEAARAAPDMATYNAGPDGYLKLVGQAKMSLDIPVIGSLNGTTAGGWLRYARLIESAGADALELNVYDLPTDLDVSSAAVEGQLFDLVGALRRQARIPLAVKLAPYFTAPAHLARRLAAAGAEGLVLFNRFYQPDFDIEQLAVEPHLRLSGPEELSLRLHWVALLYERVQADLAVTGGVHSARDIAKSVMAGASVVQVASALYKHGVGYLATLLADLRTWLEAHGHTSVKHIQGSLCQRRVCDPAVFVRANYMKLLRAGAARAER